MKNIKFILFLLLCPLTVFSESTDESTVITSDRLEMVQGETQNHFFFYDNVVVNSQNFHATSDFLEVFSAKESPSTQDKPNDSAAPSEAVKVGAIKKIIATGNVVIKQEGRHATGGKAVILPDEEKIVLTENPVVTDAQGTVSGYRMTLLRGQSKAIVEGGPDGERSQVVLPAMPNFNAPNQESSQPSN